MIKIPVIVVFIFFNCFVNAQITAKFILDMKPAIDSAIFNPETDDIFISGNFAGWPLPGTDPDLKMTLVNDTTTIYSFSTEITGFDVIEYKYYRVVNDTLTWNNGEWDGESYRKVYVLNDSVYSDIWGDKPMDITFKLDMSNANPFNPETDDIYISGNFINWTIPGLSPYFRLNKDISGDYKITLRMYKKEYKFKFYRVINGVPSWENSENQEQSRNININDTITTFYFHWGVIPGLAIHLKPTYTIFPNPVQNTLFIRNLEKTDRIEIYNMVGQKVKTIENITTPEINIDAVDLKGGIYFVSVYTAKGVMTTKFVKR